MSEPQQPPVPPYAPQPGASQPPVAPHQQPVAPHQQPVAQPYGTPPFAQPYGAASSAPAYPAAPGPRPAAGTGNGLGRIAFIVAVVTMAITLLMSLLLPFVYRAVDFGGAVFSLYNGAMGLIGIAGSVVALILGVAAIRRPGSPLLAGIAIGIAGSSVLGTIVSWMSTLFFGFF